MKTRQKLFRKHLRIIIDNTMDMQLQAMRPWQPKQFVTYDVITADWTDADFERARIAQVVADAAILGMVYGG